SLRPGSHRNDTSVRPGPPRAPAEYPGGTAETKIRKAPVRPRWQRAGRVATMEGPDTGCRNSSTLRRHHDGGTPDPEVTMPTDGGSDRILQLEEEVQQLKDAVVSHAVVDQAIGMIVALGRVSPRRGLDRAPGGLPALQHQTPQRRRPDPGLGADGAPAAGGARGTRGRPGPPGPHPRPGVTPRRLIGDIPVRTAAVPRPYPASPVSTPRTAVRPAA